MLIRVQVRVGAFFKSLVYISEGVVISCLKKQEYWYRLLGGFVGKKFFLEPAFIVCNHEVLQTSQYTARSCSSSMELLVLLLVYQTTRRPR